MMWFWRGYLSGVRCKWFAYVPADATATPSSLATCTQLRCCVRRHMLYCVCLRQIWRGWVDKCRHLCHSAVLYAVCLWHQWRAACQHSEVVPRHILLLTIRPVKRWVMRCWCDYLSTVRCKWFTYAPADATATPSSLATLKSRMVLPSAPSLPRLSWKIGH